MNVFNKFIDKNGFLNISKIRYEDIYSELFFLEFELKTLIKFLYSDKEYPTFQNIIGDVERFQYNFDTVNNAMAYIITRIEDNKSNKDLKNLIYNKINDLTSIFSKEIELNANFYNLLVHIKNKNLYESDEEKIVIEKYIQNIKNHGINLSKEKKEKLIKLKSKLQTFESKYIDNINNDIRKKYIHFKTDKSFEGIDKTYINLWQETAQKYKKKGFIIENTAENYDYILEKAKNRSLRAKMRTLYNTAALDKNHKNVKENLLLKKEIAKNLGYKNYSEYVFGISSKPFTLNQTKNILKNILKQAKKNHIKELTEFKDILSEEKITDVLGHDIDYIEEIYNKRKSDKLLKKKNIKKFNLDEYLNIDNVFKGVEIFLKKAFNISIILYKKDNIGFAYQVIKNNKLLGYIYFDLYARKLKDEGAYASGIISKTVDNVANILISCEVGSAFNFNHINDLYHELGHAIHMLAPEYEYQYMDSSKVSQDFSEFPSILFEHFLNDYDFLKTWLRHKKTKKKIPKKLKLFNINANNQKFMNLFQHKQAYFALLDLEVHTLKITKKTNLKKFEENFYKKYGIDNDRSKNIYKLNNFDHCFGLLDYSSEYYSYIVSRLMAQHSYYKFKRAKMDNWNIVGNDLYNKFLKKGNNGMEMADFIKFAGKIPDYSILFKKA